MIGVWGVVMARVYVSSPIADLTEERRAVLDWLRLARHQAVDSYLPNSDTVRDSCLDDVAACDLYVLITSRPRCLGCPPGPGWAPAATRCRSTAGSVLETPLPEQPVQPTAQASREDVAATP